MRTNIDIDDDLMDKVMAKGSFKTKKEAVEAGLQLLSRQVAMRDLAQMGGAVSWGWGDEDRLDGQANWRAVEPTVAQAPAVAESSTAYRSRAAAAAKKSRAAPAPEPKVKSRARR